MGCFLAAGALITPRLLMVVLWVFTDYLERAFETFVWPFLGFLFLPTTTIAYAVAQNSFDGVRGAGVAVLVLGVALDLGLLRKGSKGRSPLARRR